MIINDLIFAIELGDIIGELQSQLQINHIPLLANTRETPTDIMVCCPYHKGGQEKRPSAGIRKSDGQFHCLACGETHSLQEMISHCFGYTDDMVGAFGWNWLLKNFLTVSTESRKDIELDMGRPIHSPNGKTIQVPKWEYNFVSEEELDGYRYFHPYMYKRKMTDEVIEKFDIGYDRSTNCITFPVRDVVGRTLFVARRNVATKYFNYPQGVEKPVYGLFEIYQSCDLEKQEVIICESMIDAITCWVYGKYAVALNGLGNDLQFEQLNKMPCRKFILATDQDEAGMRARKRLRKRIKNKLITEYVWDLSKAKDINDMDNEMFNNLEEIF